MFARIHRFHLVVDLAALLAVLVILGITRNPWGGLAGFSVLSVHAFAAFRHPTGGVQDERDVAHKLTAARAGFAASWVVFALTATGVVVAYGVEPMPSWILSYMVMGGWLVQSSVGSLVALKSDEDV